jgi:hypothetical protein
MTTDELGEAIDNTNRLFEKEFTNFGDVLIRSNSNPMAFEYFTKEEMNQIDEWVAGMSDLIEDQYWMEEGAW